MRAGQGTPFYHAVECVTTGPELWADTEGNIDIFVAPLGTGGTLTGVAEAIKPLKQDFRVVGVEPAEAPFISEGRFAPHRMMGTAPGFMPGLNHNT